MMHVDQEVQGGVALAVPRVCECVCLHRRAGSGGRARLANTGMGSAGLRAGTLSALLSAPTPVGQAPRGAARSRLRPPCWACGTRWARANAPLPVTEPGVCAGGRLPTHGPR